MEPQFEYPFRELRCNIHADLYKRYKDRLSRRNLEAITPANPTAARAVLLALVEKATERLRQLEAEHQEVAGIVDELQTDILAFDDTKGGENLRRLSGSCNRLLLQNVEAVHKGRRETGGGGRGWPRQEAERTPVDDRRKRDHSLCRRLRAGERTEGPPCRGVRGGGLGGGRSGWRGGGMGR